MRVIPLALLVACHGGTDSGDPVDLSHLVGILITPDHPVVPIGGTVQLKATGLLDDRSTSDLTAVVDWSSTAPGVASVGTGLDQEGVLTGVSVGETRVSCATNGVISADDTVAVTDAALLGVTVEPKDVTLAVGDTVQLTANAAWSDGTRGDASAQVRWVTGDGDIATLEAGGLLTGVGAGSTPVHAEWDTTVSNTATATVIGAGSGLPDLNVGEITVESGGGFITVTVRVDNDGGNSAGGFFTDVFLDPAQPPAVGDYGDDFTLIDYVGPNGESTLLSYVFEVGSGAHTLYAVVDSGGAVEESDEANNVGSTPFTTSTTDVGGPNLTITYFDWIADADTVYYAVDVYNGGGEDAPPFYIDLYLDEDLAPTVPSDGDEFVDVAGLAAGDTTFADFLLTRTCGYCTSWLLIDSYDEVVETNESDNLAGPVTVSPPDTGWDTGY